MSVRLAPRTGEPREVDEHVWAAAVRSAADAGAVSAWFAGRLAGDAEAELMPFDSNRIGRALLGDRDRALADLGAWLEHAGVVLVRPAAAPATAAAEDAHAAVPASEAAGATVEGLEDQAGRPAPSDLAPQPAAQTVPQGPTVAPPAPPTAGRRRRGLLGPLFAALAVLAKFKAVFLVLLKGPFAFSMLASFGLYAFVFGLRFAALLIVLLLVHELGHVIAARLEGIPTSAPMFIPFLGAAVALRDRPRDAWVGAKIALAGPALGGLGALAIFLVGEQIDSNALRAAASVGFLLNLFNLLPVPPLDGGSAIAAIHPAVWAVGALGLVALVALWPNPFVILIAFFGLMEAWSRWKEFRRDGEEARLYYRVRLWQRFAVGFLYFGLAAALTIGMVEAHVTV